MAEDRRFGFKMRALRGEFDKGGEDRESGTSLASILFSFPGVCELKIVARKEGDVVHD
eukprot:CAMPEP_0206262738 /NCGR_PEP_ID=MMETSP0047_2-20121206/28417_1 /ASSEMBLY_ACC=CAM_ASM_000192 /TAXON_ID=195065 /ORGANISM="Chroomonas mesostigmatica_cf, Strain CCMP1168" /LENGTH=57 /DNA_ID=CAMNT_0053690177 /DNA_START=18 /DNA_END=188 /DNA_ORIENTATION=-